jgi:chemotaxis protein CheC
MTLTGIQRDALAEMANISASRAAKQLSILLQDTIEINVPKVEMHPIEEMRRRLQQQKSEHGMVCVYQEFSGSIQGRLHLVFHDEGSKALVHALVGEAITSSEDALRAYEHEAMTEIGNIIISTFGSMLADLLETEIRLSIPHYAEGDAHEVLCGSEGADDEAGNVIIVAETVLRAAHQDISGALMVILRLESAAVLLSQLDRILSGIQ